MQGACAEFYCHLVYMSVSYVSRYLINGTTGKILLSVKCVVWFSLQFLSETFIVRRRIYWDITNLHGFSCKVPATLVRFKLNLSFLGRYSKKNSQISNFTKIRQVGAELFHADGRTDRDVTKLTVAFRNFANAPNNLKPSVIMSVRTG
jgi:hypothetical protein